MQRIQSLRYHSMITFLWVDYRRDKYSEYNTITKTLQFMLLFRDSSINILVQTGGE